MGNVPVFKLKPNDFHRPGEREDYSVLHEGKVVGRIYSPVANDPKRWLWALNGFSSRLADTREEAMAALKAQWLR